MNLNLNLTKNLTLNLKLNLYLKLSFFIECDYDIIAGKIISVKISSLTYISIAQHHIK